MKKVKLLVISAILGTSLLASTSVFAKNNININRLAGQDRYGTSDAIVSQGWKQSNYAVLVNSQNFPDAITASPLAKKYNAPILLTDSNSLNYSTEQKLHSLDVKNVFIIGGPGVVSSDVENTIKNMNINVTRIWGKDRYETSVNVAKELGPSNGVFIVSGEHYEDALAAAPIADKLQYPILLVSRDSVPDIVENYVSNIRNNGKEVALVGGSDVFSNIIAYTLNPTKTYNQSTKYDRNLALINDYKEKLDLSKVYIASTKGFADALSGSALAGMNGNPIILVGDSNQSNVNSFVNNNNVSNVNVLGGTGVLSDQVISDITGYSNGTENTNKDTGIGAVNNNKEASNTAVDFYDFQKQNPVFQVKDGCVLPSKMFDPNNIFYVGQQQYSMKNAIIFSDYNAFSYGSSYPHNVFTYSLNKKYKKLTGYYAVNDDVSVKDESLVLASVFGIDVDGTYKFAKSAKKGDQPVYFEVDLNGADKLTFDGGCQSNTDLYDNTNGMKTYYGGVLFDLKLEQDSNQDNSVTTNSSTNNADIVIFKDKNLEKAVRDTIGKSTGDITKDDVENITKLQVVGTSLSDLSGIENLTNLQTLFLDMNKISDINPLKGLTNLTYLELPGNPISNDHIDSLQLTLPKCKINFYPLN